MYEFLKSILFHMDAEKAHRLTIDVLKKAPSILIGNKVSTYPTLKTSLWGRNFPNPLGLAAGFDKNAEAVSSLFRLGFGFVEAGTVTLRAQEGNSRPRVFRDIPREAIINRMGFPNTGVAVFKDNITAFLMKRPRPLGVLGINIGMNKDQTDAAKDYTALVRSLGPLADYLTINISSPNTPGLRNLQEPDTLRELLTQVLSERSASCGNHPPPLLVKLAPDLSDKQLQGITNVLLDLKIDGVILGNTTLDRPDILAPHFATEKGGLSGKPLCDKSTLLIARFYTYSKGQIPIIGVGGISSAEDAYTKIKAGASLIQIYSALVYQGPRIIHAINDGLVRLLRQDGYNHLSEAIGADHKTSVHKTEDHTHARSA